MNHAVAEIGGENLALDRTIDDETDAPAWFVSPVDYIVMELEKFGFVVRLKSQGVGGGAFVFSGIKICLKQIDK